MRNTSKTATTTFSATLIGVEAQLVEVEADQRGGMIKMHIVGMADKSCAEAKERIKNAVKNMGFSLPRGQFTFNLAPAEIPKTGAGFDLAMAIALLIRRGEVPEGPRKETLLLGELALDGKIRGVHGVLAAAQMAKVQGFKKIIVPNENRDEASLVAGIEVYSAKHLKDVVQYFWGENNLVLSKSDKFANKQQNFNVDFSHIRGHAFAKRALEVAAAGGHNILLNGPPGSGKTMLAKSLLSIMPPLDLDEVIEITKIHSAAGLLGADNPYIEKRPFRAPHHSASAVSLVGGGSIPKPGEISLAHRGVLFLDELPEFPRQVLENLRQPLEGGMITVSRARQTLDFPARFLLIAAMNPCPCGFITDPEQPCRCSANSVSRYQSKLSGPLLDRFDIFIEVPRLIWQELINDEKCDDSNAIRQRVITARELQASRKEETGVLINQELKSNVISDQIKLNQDCLDLLETASRKMNFSNRAYYRILRVARTIADLGGEKDVVVGHIAEALQYRG